MLSPVDYHIKNVGDLDSPSLVIYPEIVRENIRQAVQIAGNVQRLRPHVKTNKSPQAIGLLQEAGISKFKCATIAEAELLAQCGASDVLLAYQPVGPKLERFVALVQKFPATQFSCLADTAGAAEAIAKRAVRSGFEIPLFIDLNVGQDRTGIAPEAAFELYQYCAGLEGVRPVGLHAYDGHLRQADFTARTSACDQAFLPVSFLQQKIRSVGLGMPIVVAGGSPTFPIHAKWADLECSPGTFIYWDKGYADLCPEQPFQPAALLVTRVISLPDATKICLDLGHKAVAAENDLSMRVWFPEAPGLTPLSQSEEHLVLEAGAGHRFKTGDLLYGLPYHICPTVALYESTPIAVNGIARGEWYAPARNRKITC